MLFVSGNIIKSLCLFLPSLIDRHSCCEFREFIFSILAAVTVSSNRLWRELFDWSLGFDDIIAKLELIYIKGSIYQPNFFLKYKT